MFAACWDRYRCSSLDALMYCAVASCSILGLLAICWIRFVMYPTSASGKDRSSASRAVWSTSGENMWLMKLSILEIRS